MPIRRTHSLHKSRQILQRMYDWYRRNSQTLPGAQLSQLENQMASLQEALSNRDKGKASQASQQLEEFAKQHIPKNALSTIRELAVAIILALIIATLIRQSWFELYQIPTGSMRPTFREKDHLVVSKTSFGINVPIKPGHLYFDEQLTQRAGIAIFTGHGLDMEDTDDTYFYLFPYTKRYIKRLMGKPGDTLYFYGGQIYGLNREGEEIKELLEAPCLSQLEHIPYYHMEGRVEFNSQNDSLELRHFGIPTARLMPGPTGKVEGEIFYQNGWHRENLLANGASHSEPQTYNDLYGIGNYAMTRLLTGNQVTDILDVDPASVGEGILYLELRHHPLISRARLRPQLPGQGNTPLQLTPFVSLIPLAVPQVETLMSHLYTNRFYVEGERMRRYGLPANTPAVYLPRLPGVPDGLYEFYYGKAYEITTANLIKELPADHPLNSKRVELAQTLYNLGIEGITAYAPTAANQIALPSRYAYFREGDLYLMGAPFLRRDDPLLTAFVQKEREGQQGATAARPYQGFIDRGPPLKEDGSFDREFILSHGLKVPERHYVMLGDNHAFSSDSRYFGFVPEANLRGSPEYLLWPAGDRWGSPPQPYQRYWNVPTVTMWLLLLAALAGWYWWSHRRDEELIYRKISS